MGIRFYCPNGHKLNVKSFLAGKRGICPHCDSRFDIPQESLIPENAPKVRPMGERVPSAAGAGVSVATTQESPATAVASLPEANADDPIAQSPDSVWYVRPPAGGQFGPARGDVLRQWIAEGRISTDSMVWREGWSDWQTAGLVLPGLIQSPASDELSETQSEAAEESIRPSELAIAEEPSPTRIRGKPTTSRHKGSRKSIALVVCLGLLIVVLIVVLVMVLPR